VHGSGATLFLATVPLLPRKNVLEGKTSPMGSRWAIVKVHRCRHVLGAIPVNLWRCSAILSVAGIPHHHDLEEEVIRMLFITTRYRNRRGEKLLVMSLAVSADGCHYRLWVPQPFGTDRHSTATHMSLRQLACESLLFRVERDAESWGVRMLCEMPCGNSAFVSHKLDTTIRCLITASETWANAVRSRKKVAD